MNHNGTIKPAFAFAFDTAGQGIFETMKMIDGSITLKNFHLDRLTRGMHILGLQPDSSVTLESLMSSISELSQRNNINSNARVRLSLYRSIYSEVEFAIECTPLESYIQHGLIVGIYDEAYKPFGEHSNLKLLNRYPYAQASDFAAKHGYDDALVFNALGNICDSSIANVFWITGNRLYTPPLSEGCVAGVYRRYLLKHPGLQIEQKPLTPGDLELADEVFLTNALRGIRSVSKIGDRALGSSKTMEIVHMIEQNP